MTYTILTIVHVLLTMGGYAGLIAVNVWLLLLCRTGESAIILKAAQTWQATVRVFGPLLGAGVLVGLALSLVMGISLLSTWLIATYALILIVLSGHAALMVPFSRRVEQMVASGEAVSTRPIVLAISLLTFAYLCIPALMFIRPS